MAPLKEPAPASKKQFHVVLCTGKDIKGLIATNLADQFLTPKNIKLTVFLGADPPKTEGARLASQFFGPYEHDHWFGGGEDDFGYIGELDNNHHHRFEERNIGEERAFSTFEELKQRGIDVTVLEKKINHSHYLEILRSIEPDVIYSARFQQIFKEPILKIPTHGILNMHPGALPGYKGLHVDMRAMMHEIDNLTMTLHEVDTGIDTGKFLNDHDVKVDSDSSLLWHRLQLQVGGMNMFFQEVIRLACLEGEDYEIPRQERDQSAEGQYFTWPDHEEYKKFDDMGLKHFEDSDFQFIKGLFDKRLNAHSTIKQEADGGMFMIA